MTTLDGDCTRVLAAHDAGAHSSIRTPGCPKCDDLLAVHHDQGLHNDRRVPDCSKCYPQRHRGHPAVPLPSAPHDDQIVPSADMNRRLLALDKALHSRNPVTKRRAETILTKMDELSAVIAADTAVEVKRAKLAELRKVQARLLRDIDALQTEIRELTGQKRPGRRPAAIAPPAQAP